MLSHKLLPSYSILAAVIKVLSTTRVAPVASNAQFYFSARYKNAHTPESPEEVAEWMDG
jgi:hypothetical protein